CLLLSTHLAADLPGHRTAFLNADDGVLCRATFCCHCSRFLAVRVAVRPLDPGGCHAVARAQGSAGFWNDPLCFATARFSSRTPFRSHDSVECCVFWDWHGDIQHLGYYPDAGRANGCRPMDRIAEQHREPGRSGCTNCDGLDCQSIRVFLPG